MTGTGKPDDDQAGERPAPERPDQAPPPPQWLNSDARASGPVPLLPEDEPEPQVPESDDAHRTAVMGATPPADTEEPKAEAARPAPPPAQAAPPASTPPAAAPVTSTDIPAPPPFPYAQEIPGRPAAPPAQNLPAPPAPPAPAQSPSAPEPFPYAQEIPGQPAAPPAQNPPAPAPPAQSSPAAEPFPYAQEIPSSPALPAPRAPEPFPYAQQVPDRPAAPPSAEPFPHAQQVPGRPGPEAAGPALPPPLIDEPWRTPQTSANRPRRSVKKPLLIGIAGLAAAALVAAGGFFLLTGGGDGAAGTAGGEVELAGALFGANSAGTTDGRDQRLTAVAAAGSTVVAAGGESDASGSRGQFLVSTDGGRTFSSGRVTGPGGGEPPPNEVPRTVAGSAKGWVALGGPDGNAVLWTSRDGRTWERLPAGAAQPFGKGTRVKEVHAAPDGFIAIGSTSRKGDFSDAEPAVWTSADGRTWQIRSGGRLDLPVRKGEVTLVTAAASGGVLLLEGVHRPDPKKPARSRKVWRSEDGGGTWTESIIPVPKGGSRGMMIGGGANGFLAVREVKGGGQFFSSTDGKKWTKVAKLDVSGYKRVEAVLSDDQGFAAIVVRGRDRLVSRSADGRSWKDAGTVPLQRGTTVRGAALAGGQSIMVGTQDGDGDTDALLAVHDGSGGDVPIDLSKVAGAVRPDLAVTSLAASDGKAVAVGSANGEAAAWTSADGRTWNRAQGTGAALSRPGPQRLLSVTSGPQGWLAVGFDQAKPRRPLVVTSADGTSWQAADESEVFKAGEHELVTYSAASGPAGYVIVGDDGLSAATWFSPDLKNWTRGTGVGGSGLKALPNSNRWLRSVAGGQFGFAAAGGLRDPAAPRQSSYRPAVWTSSDGEQWTLKQLPLPPGVQEGVLTQISAKGGTLVATGNARKAAGRIAIGYLSGDGGRTWKPVDLPSPEGTKNLEVLSLTATPDGFAAAGTSGSPGAGDVVSWTSADGASWKGALLDAKGLSGAGDQQITGLAAFKNTVLGVGRTSGQSGEQPVLWSRPG
ncbi:hypothetical protein ABTW95_26090 [Spirillospora sp. NPDC127506]